MEHILATATRTGIRGPILSPTSTSIIARQGLIPNPFSWAPSGTVAQNTNLEHCSN